MAAAGHTAACVSAKVEGRGGVTLERERLSSFILGMNSGVWFFFSSSICLQRGTGDSLAEVVKLKEIPPATNHQSLGRTLRPSANVPRLFNMAGGKAYSLVKKQKKQKEEEEKKSPNSRWN